MSRKIGYQFDKLSSIEIDAMFKVYVDHDGKVSKIAKIVKHDPKTIKRYISKFNFVERLAEIRRKAEEGADNAAAKRLQRQLRHIRYSIEKVVQGIRKGTVETKLSDLDKLVRLEEFLSGNADSREEQVIKIEFKKHRDNY